MNNSHTCKEYLTNYRSKLSCITEPPILASCELEHMTLTYRLDLKWVTLNHHGKYLGQRSFLSTAIVRTVHTDWSSVPGAKRRCNKSSAVAEMGDRLATIDMARKVGAVVPLSVGLGPL